MAVKRRSIEAIVRSLNERRVRYLVVGGLAVVAHGHVRFTADIDLVLDLDEANLRRALEVLHALGYRPRAPVQLEQFADPETRASWIRDKGLKVFSLYSDLHPATEVDLFVEDPLGFETAYAKTVRMEVAPGVEATMVSLDDLLELKRAAARPQDLLDVEQLESLREGRKSG